MRLSNLADYAIVLMGAAARQCGGTRLTAARLAEVAHVPEATAHKLVQRLVRSGLLRAVRGPGGGIKLARPAAAISLADIIEAIEGPIAMTNCIDDGTCACGIKSNCAVRPHWQAVNGAVRGALAAVTLANMSGHAPMEHVQ
ncbi:MAG: Rrf2 family transcriptional regulator [Sphingomonadaceae bacterium]|nr:Rrf2 family transcriptional regulator [Sphingomonadaceae bacterium]